MFPWQNRFTCAVLLLEWSGRMMLTRALDALRRFYHSFMSKYVSLQTQHLARYHFLGGKSNQLLSWKLRFVSLVARHGHKQIAASVLRNINGWEWMVEGTSTLNRKSQNQDQLQPTKPSNPSKLHSSPLSPFPFPLTPPQKKPKLFFHVLQKKNKIPRKWR